MLSTAAERIIHSFMCIRVSITRDTQLAIHQEAKRCGFKFIMYTPLPFLSSTVSQAYISLVLEAVRFELFESNAKCT